MTADQVRALKGRERIAVLTAYDYPSARLLEEAGIRLLLVGDSLGMVVLGHPDTTQVTLEDMEHHVAAVARGSRQALLVADLPYGTYRTSDQAVNSARRLVRAGAGAVKAEGGRSIAQQAAAIIDGGIPFMGHLGMLPQHVHEEGGYRVKGKTAEEAEGLRADAESLVAAGAFAIVLELVTPPVAAELTSRISVPTIGIGSGPGTDGQVLVTHDLVGAYPWFTPRHVRPRCQVGAEIRLAAAEWRKEIEGG